MRRFVRLRGAAALAGFAAFLFSSAAANSSAPPLLWQGARSLAVQCLVQRGPNRNDVELGSALCARVARLAARGSTLPVAVVPIGDPAVMAPDTVALLVHGSVEQVRGGPVIAFSVTPFRATDQSSVLFAAAPRAVALPGTALAGPALDAALTAVLSETLPWQATPQGARALPTRN